MANSIERHWSCSTRSMSAWSARKPNSLGPRAGLLATCSVTARSAPKMVVMPRSMLALGRYELTGPRIPRVRLVHRCRAPRLHRRRLLARSRLSTDGSPSGRMRELVRRDGVPLVAQPHHRGSVPPPDRGRVGQGGRRFTARMPPRRYGTQRPLPSRLLRRQRGRPVGRFRSSTRDETRCYSGSSRGSTVSVRAAGAA